MPKDFPCRHTALLPQDHRAEDPFCQDVTCPTSAWNGQGWLLRHPCWLFEVQPCIGNTFRLIIATQQSCSVVYQKWINIEVFETKFSEPLQMITNYCLAKIILTAANYWVFLWICHNSDVFSSKSKSVIQFFAPKIQNICISWTVLAELYCQFMLIVAKRRRVVTNYYVFGKA